MDKLRALIDEALDRYLPPQETQPRVLHKAMRYSVFSGGKRIRPVIVIESARACGGSIRGAVPAACAIELVHTYSLIHDDLPAMDDDDYRRGRPSCHKKFGEANAILAGDSLLTLCFNILSRYLKRDTAAKAVECISNAAGTSGMTGGQSADIDFKHKKKNRKILNLINDRKTAKLFEASSRLGAITASAGREVEASMAKFGAALGIAFQITDDIVDGDGYVMLIGKNRARDEASAFIEKAKGSLAPFGKKADALKTIADSILDRIN